MGKCHQESCAEKSEIKINGIIKIKMVVFFLTFYTVTEESK